MGGFKLLRGPAGSGCILPYSGISADPHGPLVIIAWTVKTGPADLSARWPQGNVACRGDFSDESERRSFGCADVLWSVVIIAWTMSVVRLAGSDPAELSRRAAPSNGAYSLRTDGFDGGRVASTGNAQSLAVTIHAAA